ncbi:LysR family transcriptional regulator [Cognatishimia maritima]|uniref:DNA-binding transcriptional regulator, LysR family n=1 Tax=Cognatishimia maritima TaxID=870908 RepID=A0A1M5K6B1_9RHOB|nr:LysR family transcriptional regulator [Cognatishimia maritima]SHG48325.1 DNA-binding transcriptional regulator, LysR family [Cognatishimia maritima]
MKNQNIYKVDAHLLRVFLKVCELHSVSRAADVFDLNQSTVSNMMDRLRQAVGFRLFEKVGRNIVPTEDAKDLIPRAARIVSAIEGLPEAGTYDPSQDSRPITIVGNLNSMLGVLQCIQDAVRAECPSRHVRFLELGSRDQLEERLEDGNVDFAISVRTPRYPPSLSAHLLFEDRSVVYFDGKMRSAPTTRAEYFRSGHGVLDFGGYVRSTVDNDVRGLQAHRRIVCSASNASVLAHMIAGTDLLASMPSHLRLNVFKSLSWAPLPLSPNTTLKFDLLWHKRNANSSRHKWIKNIILEADTQGATQAILD